MSADSSKKAVRPQAAFLSPASCRWHKGLFAAQALQDHNATEARTTFMGDPAFPGPGMAYAI
ncbi:hypothetical protein CS8_092310 [Cupriavidus sp. 8B]